MLPSQFAVLSTRPGSVYIDLALLPIEGETTIPNDEVLRTKDTLMNANGRRLELTGFGTIAVLGYTMPYAVAPAQGECLRRRQEHARHVWCAENTSAVIVFTYG